MKHYHIVGQNNAVISMILEALYCLHSHFVEVVIVANISSVQTVPYQLDRIKTTEISHEHWMPDASNKFLLGVFSPASKRQVYDFFLNKYKITTDNYETIVHPAATIATNVMMANGVHVGPSVVIAPYVELGNFVTINRQVSIGHHTKIGDFSTINPGCNIAGGCTIGKNVAIGMGVNIVNDIEIGDNAIIGAGSLITKSVAANTLVYGVPAREIKKITTTNA